MDLDNQDFLSNINHNLCLLVIQNMPNRFKRSWEVGLSSDVVLPNPLNGVVLVGKDERAVGAEIFLDYVSRWCQAPAFVYEGDYLPAWVRGAGMQVIYLVGSGDSRDLEGMISASLSRECQVAVCRFGELPSSHDHPWLPKGGCLFDILAAQGREAVETIGFLTGLFNRWGIIPDQARVVEAVIDRLNANQTSWNADTPVNRNPAKRAAGQLVGRWAVVFGSEYLAPVARRWKIQLNRIAKSWSQWEEIPGAEYHTPSGLIFPERVLPGMLALFLQGSLISPETLAWSNAVRKLFMQQGMNTDYFSADGDNLFEQIFSALQFGEYTAFYLAIANGIDPAPVDIKEYLKENLKS